MPLTTLDSNAALVLIDLQKGIVAIPAVHPIGEIIDRAAQLARAFRKLGQPVILVNVTGVAPGRTDSGARNLSSFPADWTELVPELEQHPNDQFISKQRIGATFGTSLDSRLRQHGITQVSLAGVATSLGVESIARSAHDHSYNIVLVTDAMTDRDAAAHRHTVEKIFPRLGETETTANVLDMLGSS